MDAQESNEINTFAKQFADMPPRPTQGSQLAKRDTLESHKLFKKQKLLQQQRAGTNQIHEKDRFHKALHQIDGPL